MNNVEKRAKAIDFIEFPRQGAGEVEAEAVHMHVGNPIAQAVHDQLQDPRMAHIEGIAAAGDSPCKNADPRV